MKCSASAIKNLILPGLLAMFIPLASHADPQFGKDEEHNHCSPFPNEMHLEHHFGHGGGALYFLHGIDLSETQRDKIFSIKHAQEALLYEQSKIVRNEHIELHKLASSDQYEDEKAKAITENLGKALARITFLRVQERHQIYALLTPEQRNLLNSHHFDRSSAHPRFPSMPEVAKPGAASRP